MKVQPTVPRFTTRKEGEVLIVTLPRKLHLFSLIFLIPWLALLLYISIYIVGIWLVYLVAMIAAPFFAETYNSIGPAMLFFVVLSVPMAFSLFVGWGGIYTLLWQLGGKEIIETNPSKLVLTKQIFRWRRLAEYPWSEVNELKADPTLPDCRYVPRRIIPRIFGNNGMLSFKHGDKTIRFGLEVEEAEARIILDAIESNQRSIN